MIASRQQLTAIEVGCDDCSWTYVTNEDRKKKAEARRHAKETGHSTWADIHYHQHFDSANREGE